MSTIWTPSGERPIRREPEPAAAAPPPPTPATGYQGAPPDEPSEEELAAHLAEVQRQLLTTPAAVVISNHCIGLFQLAALHLDQPTPNLADAKIAIDAMGAIVETLGPRLGEDQGPLADALTQLRLAYVQRQRDASATPEG